MNQLNKYVVCKVGEESFGLSIDQVIAIEKVMGITQIPSTPEYILGICKVRETVTPIMDMGLRLMDRAVQHNEHNRLVLVNVQDRQMALLVDQADNIMEISGDEVETVDVSHIKDKQHIQVANVQNRLIILVDIEYMFNGINQQIFEEIKEAI